MKRKEFHNRRSVSSRMIDENSDAEFSCLCFEVLYYPKSSSMIGKNSSSKKKKKNPKNSQDGILRFLTNSNQLQLRCMNLDDDNNSDIIENDKDYASNIVYNSGCSIPLAKRLLVLSKQQNNNDDDDENEDAVISFGPWECQIISRLDSSPHAKLSSLSGNNNKCPPNQNNVLLKNVSSLNKLTTAKYSRNTVGNLSKYSLSRKKNSVVIRRPLVSSSKKTETSTTSSSSHEASNVPKSHLKKTLLPSATLSFHIKTKQNDESTPVPSFVESSTSQQHTSRFNRTASISSNSIGNSSGRLSSQIKQFKINSSSSPKINRPSLLSSSSKRLKRTFLPSTAIRTNSLMVQSSSVSSFRDGSKSDVKSGNMIIPPSIRQLLRPHQQKGIQFLWKCVTEMNGPAAYKYSTCNNYNNSSHEMKKGAILADEMGLGKTLMTISIIFALHRKNRNHRYIVVCPSSLVGNWSKEFDKWLGKASQPKRTVIQKGGETALALLRAFVPSKPPQIPGEVLIISYEMFRMNATNLLCKTKNVGLLVVDEGHRLKNSNGSLTLSALNSLQDCEAKLLITGTPIQNNLSEFYNIANFVRPGIFGDLGMFRKDFERPISLASHKNATQEQKRRARHLSIELDTITSTFMLRRLQKDILKHLLPPRSEILLFCKPSLLQCQIYKDLNRDFVTSNNGRISPTCSADSLMLLTKVRKLCSHPHLLSQRSLTQNSDNNGFVNSCDVKDNQLDTQHDVSLSGKLLVLDSLLQAIREQCPSDKVVVISNFTSALSIIEDVIITQRNWSSLRLDGSIPQSARQTLVDSFNRTTADKNFVLLLSSKAGGCGLNLIGANRLIMFDPDWNPATDMQAMARVYREGQTKPCFIYRFFTSGTVEEVIFQRQTQKIHLDCLTAGNFNNSNTITDKKRKDPISIRNQSNNCFTKEELRDCFTLKEGCDCDTKDKLGKNWSEFNGLESLQKDGFCDEPLFQVVKDNQSNDYDTGLAFVHIVDNRDDYNSNVETRVSDDSGSNILDEDIDMNLDESSFSEESTSTEEAEFDS